jgi:hypothetical protein
MHRKHMLSLIGLVIVSRVVLIAGTLWWNAVSLPQYVSMHDGREYLVYSTRIDEYNLADLPHETTRLFPGYPLAISGLGRMFGKPLASVAVSVLGALLAVMIFHALFRDFWLSAYFAVFTPSWLLYSSLAMSEGLFLGCSLLGLYLFHQNRDIQAALVLGFATVVRPVGVLLFLAIAVAMFMERDFRALVRFGVVFLVIPLVWAFISKLAWGTFGKNIATLHSYLERDFDIPLRAIIVETLKPQVSLLKKLLVWGHVLLGIGGFILLVWGWMHDIRLSRSLLNYVSATDPVGASTHSSAPSRGLCCYSPPGPCDWAVLESQHDPRSSGERHDLGRRLVHHHTSFDVYGLRQAQSEASNSFSTVSYYVGAHPPRRMSPYSFRDFLPPGFLPSLDAQGTQPGEEYTVLHIKCP